MWGRRRLVALAAGGGLAYAYLALPDAGPVPDVTLDTSPEAVARGAYLAHHVMGCAGCHSARDHRAFGHPVAPGTEGMGGDEFGGDGLHVYAPNITPAAIGAWSDGELWHAVTTGVTPDGRALFPIMPWPKYAKASKQDLNDVLAYVRSLEPIENEVAERVLPGPLPVLVNLMPEPAQNPDAAPDPSDEVAYGEYVFTIAGCADCHTPRDDMGRPLPGLDLAGGTVFPMPGHPEYGLVRSANLTPDDATGLGTWTREQFVGRFKAALDDPRNGVIAEPGHTWTLMPWAEYAGMTEADLGAMFAWLQTVPPIRHEVVRFELAEGVEARGWPPAPPQPEGVPTRGALGALCDTVTTDGLAPDGLYAPEAPDAALMQAAAQRAKWRDFAGFSELEAGLASRTPPERQQWLAGAARLHGIDARCEAVLAVRVPATAEDGEQVAEQR